MTHDFFARTNDGHKKKLGVLLFLEPTNSHRYRCAVA
jgi:hypothetical protein